MNVSAIIVTRGDVDLSEILGGFPSEWEVLVWDNGRGSCRRVQIPEWAPFGVVAGEGDRAPDEALDSPSGWDFTAFAVSNLSVYGRYAAIEYANGKIVYIQDDDVLHATEGIREIAEAYEFIATCATHGEMHYEIVSGYAGWICDECSPRRFSPDAVVCNMPANFRAVSFYQEHALVGFGAAFHRDAPRRAFERFLGWTNPPTGESVWGFIPDLDGAACMDFFDRTCDIVFTGLTPRILVDVPYDDMPWASADNRMWRQADHRAERGRMLDLVLKMRDEN